MKKLVLGLLVTMVNKYVGSIPTVTFLFDNVNQIVPGGDNMASIPNVILKNTFKDDIDDMLLNGVSLRQVEQFLKERGEPISRQTLGKYKKEHLDVNSKAVDLYLERNQSKLEEEVEKQVSTLEFYDKLIAAGTSVNPLMMDDSKVVDAALKAAKDKEAFLSNHGDKEAELQSQLMKDILDELRAQGMDAILRDLSDKRTEKRRTTRGDDA